MKKEIHRHVNIVIENAGPGPKKAKVECATPEEFGEWIRSCPKMRNVKSVRTTVEISLQQEDWVTLAIGAARQGCTVDEMISLIMQEEAIEFLNRGYKTPLQEEEEREGESGDGNHDPADFWKK